MDSGWIVILIIAALIGAMLWALRTGTLQIPGNRTGGAGQRGATGGSSDITALRKNLRSKALGNDALVDRLVQAERRRMPGASDAECYRAAIESWERDNR